MNKLVLSAVLALAASTAHAAPAKNIVLVHGAWADGGTWQGVYKILVAHGYKVSIVQNPLTSLDDDVKATKRVLARQTGPVVLVGHSYGGVVITEAGTDPKVATLVYIAAFAPDAGESLASLGKGQPAPPVQPSADGFLFFDPTKFQAGFAADLPADQAAWLADAQVPPSAAAFGGVITTPAWKTKPSYYLVPTEDRAIGAGPERVMAKRAGSIVTETKGSHAIYISNPKVVAEIIEKAAKSVK